MPIYRSLRLVVQNSTAALLTVEAAELLRGTWGRAAGIALRGARIAPQSAAKLECVSQVLECGCEGFLRLSSVAGLLDIRWDVPWVGRFALDVDNGARDRAVERILMNDLPATPAALVVLSGPCGGAPSSSVPVRRAVGRRRG